MLHPGSWKGLTREEGLRLAVEGIERATDGLPWQDHNFKVLIENTAGAEFSLGGTLGAGGGAGGAAARVRSGGRLLGHVPSAVKGYDIVTAEGMSETMKLMAETVGLETVRVWHCNDAKAARGSKLDRHEHVGKGTIGSAAFRRLLHDERFAHAAFIAETPVDEPGDEQRNLNALKELVKG